MTASVGRDNPQPCPAVRKDGQACTAQAGPTGFCIGHRPGAAEARRRGGAGTSRASKAQRLLPSRLRPVVTLLETALDEVHRGKITPAQGAAMASLAGAIVRVFSAGELEERLRKLESVQ